MKKQLSQIATWLKQEMNIQNNITVTGVSINTKTLQPGDLFIPFKGEKVNGHQYVKQAFEKGASAALWQNDEPNPPSDLPLILVENCEHALQMMAQAYREEHKATFIGITGSNGKTSTKDLVAGVLSPYFRVQKTVGNFNNNLGLPLTILALHEDTQFAVLEMGMSGYGEIAFLSNLAKPHYVAITNIGEAHMQDLGSRAGIAKAKFEIIEGLKENGKLFYDGDEPLLSPLVEEDFKGESFSFGYDGSNDISAVNIMATEQGSQFDVSGVLSGAFSIPVLGKHQVKNALVAILIANEAGLSTNQIQQSLQHVSLTDMRMQMIPASNGALFINDAYNAAPTSMKAAIAFTRETTIRPEKWVVLGDMLELGENEKQFHEELAEYLTSETITGICLFGPRMKWLYEILQKTWPENQILWTDSNYGLIIEKLLSVTSSESLILVKGSRGMALEKVIEPLKRG
ncbi:MAG: UDP-N-acetylmuramoyl-tripeptide--D-alanyl-D-alanine ligase [Paenisporosarcina sp.]